MLTTASESRTGAARPSAASRKSEGSGRDPVRRVALSPGQVLQDLLLNDPGHAAAAARKEGGRAAVASSVVERITSPRRGHRLP